MNRACRIDIPRATQSAVSRALSTGKKADPLDQRLWARRRRRDGPRRKLLEPATADHVPAGAVPGRPLRPDGCPPGRSDRQNLPGGQAAAAASSSSSKVTTAAELAAELEAERKRARELEVLVQQEQKKFDKLQSTQRVLEDNMSRLYEAAKEQVQEKTQQLSAARLELQRELEAKKSEVH